MSGTVGAVMPATADTGMVVSIVVSGTASRLTAATGMITVSDAAMTVGRGQRQSRR